MPIRVNCTACGSVINAPEKAAGKTGKCPKCGQGLTIPAQPKPTLPAAPSLSPPPAATPVPAVAPPSESYDVEVERDEFDVEVERDEFDVDVEAPTRPPMPIIPASPTPLPKTGSVADSAGNPFATFEPSNDAPASNLDFGLEDESFISSATNTAPRSALNPQWKSVLAGLGQLKLAAFISLLGIVVLNITSAILSLRLKVDFLTIIPGVIGLLLALVSYVVLVLGLWKWTQAPAAKEGGPGPQFAQFAFYSALAAVLLAACGVGLLAALALPFLIGQFLREVGNSLSSPATIAAANRYMIGVGVALIVGLSAAVVPFLFTAVLPRGPVSPTVLKLLNIGSGSCSGLFQLVAMLLAIMAFSTATTEIQRRLQPRTR